MTLFKLESLSIIRMGYFFVCAKRTGDDLENVPAQKTRRGVF